MKRQASWNTNYRKVWAFVEAHHRGPSRHHPEEHQMLNWMKFNRKKLNSDKLSTESKERFVMLMDFIHSFHRVNQYA